MVSFLELFVLFLVIFDPLVSTGTFVILTRDFTKDERRKTALMAAATALVPLLLFVFFGNSVLSALKIHLSDFQIGGGVILGLLGIKMVTGQPIIEQKHGKKQRSTKAVATIIGTPLLTGPAIITTTIISVAQNGLATTLAASVSALALCFIILLYSRKLVDVIGVTILEIASSIFGLVTLSWGVQFIRAGLGI
ncbi:MarC family protein [Candidatus Micrarchaeota archaeon]|nr:MarC family protein [Candidatus Micrarchaeota archaeon]